MTKVAQIKLWQKKVNELKNYMSRPCVRVCTSRADQCGPIPGKVG